MPAGDQRTLLLAEVRDAFGRVVWTHKTHEKACDGHLTTERRIKTWQILLTAITSGSVITVAVGDQAAAKIVATIFALLSTALSLYAKNFTPGAAAEKHRECASKLWLVREQYSSLIADLTANAINLDAARKRRDELVTKTAKIYETAPRTTAEDFKKAGHALNERGEMTFTPDEIDAYLPQALRVSASPLPPKPTSAAAALPEKESGGADKE